MLERKDNSLGYSEENCVWATRIAQMNNKRDNVNLTYKGETRSVAQWAVKLGLRKSTLYWRKSSGWSDEDALKVPILRGRNQTWRSKT